MRAWGQLPAISQTLSKMSQISFSGAERKWNSTAVSRGWILTSFPTMVTSHMLPQGNCPCPVQESTEILASSNQTHAKIMLNITLKGCKWSCLYTRLDNICVLAVYGANMDEASSGEDS